MLHVRFTAFVLGLLFVLHALKSCSVHAHQGEETVGEEAVVSVQKEFLAAFGGRKMGGHEVSEEIGAPKNSGANRSDGKCDFQGNEAFNVKLCKSWNETADFVAFGADYHGPKGHSPKHN
ncbi:hypothetical protein PTKIN_Ptkin15bG0185200 [Pterospermum kingtungense]